MFHRHMTDRTAYVACCMHSLLTSVTQHGERLRNELNQLYVPPSTLQNASMSSLKHVEIIIIIIKILALLGWSQKS